MKQMAQQPVVLIAEADILIGVDLSEALERAGYRVLGPFTTMSRALAAISRDNPTVAVVDIALTDGFCMKLCQELRERSVPFLIHSIFRHDQPHPISFKGAPWLVKPALPQEVVDLCDELSSFRRAPVRDGPVSSVQLLTPARTSTNPFVRKLESFAALSHTDRAVLTQISANPHSVKAGTDLVREGDRPDGVFLVMEGMACRHKHRVSGARHIMAYLVPGDAGDLDAALLAEMDHTITTFSTCEIVRIPPETIAKLLKHHPQITRALRMSTLVDEATLREWLVNVGCRSAAERIAHLFVELLLRLQVVGLTKGNSYDLPITQDDIADTAGLSSVHVNRSLKELRQQGLVELRRRRVTILDLPRLKELAEFRANYLHLTGRAAA